MNKGEHPRSVKCLEGSSIVTDTAVQMLDLFVSTFDGL